MKHLLQVLLILLIIFILYLLYINFNIVEGNKNKKNKNKKNKCSKKNIRKKCKKKKGKKKKNCIIRNTLRCLETSDSTDNKLLISKSNPKSNTNPYPDPKTNTNPDPDPKTNTNPDKIKIGDVTFDISKSLIMKDAIANNKFDNRLSFYIAINYKNDDGEINFLVINQSTPKQDYDNAFVIRIQAYMRNKIKILKDPETYVFFNNKKSNTPLSYWQRTNWDQTNQSNDGFENILWTKTEELDFSPIKISWSENNIFSITDWFKDYTFIFGSTKRQIRITNKSNNYNPEKHHFHLMYKIDNYQNSIRSLTFYPIIVEESLKNEIIHKYSYSSDNKLNYFLPIPSLRKKTNSKEIDNDINNSINKSLNIVYKAIFQSDNNVNTDNIVGLFPNNIDDWANFYYWHIKIVETNSSLTENIPQTNEFNMCTKKGNSCNNINKWNEIENNVKNKLNFKLVYLGDNNFEIQD